MKNFDDTSSGSSIDTSGTISLLAAPPDSKLPTTRNCRHSAFLNRTCMKCLMPESECGVQLTIPVSYVAPTLTLTLPKMNRVRDHNFRKLMSRKKLHLVLDLDNTLIHSSKTAMTNHEGGFGGDSGLYPVFNGSSLIKLRPGARAFLEQASALFELSIYTMSSRGYARTVARLLDPEGKYKGRVISREDCTTKKQKSLDVVLFHHRVVLILDDKVEVWAESDRTNVIPLAPYRYFGKVNSTCQDDDNDGELARVLELVKEVHSRFFDGQGFETRDVAQVLESVGRSEAQATCNLVSHEEDNKLVNFENKVGCCSSITCAKRPRESSLEGSYGVQQMIECSSGFSNAKRPCNECII